MNLSLKNFKIDIVFVRDDGSRSYIPLTVYQNGQSNFSSTYNEKITEKENSQYSLTFNIEMYVNEQRNQLVEYLVNDRILRLTIDDEEVLEFVITSRQPTFSNKGLCYNISCQDYFSYQFSKQQIDLDFSTMDEALWGTDVGPKSLDQIVNKVLEIANISNWQLNPNMNDYLLQFPDDLYDPKGKLLVSLELTNTTPYNILNEVTKLFNAILVPDYSRNPHIINFYNKERIDYKGLRLYPEINLSNFSYSDKGDNLYNIMHVTGGEDADGNYVSIVPTMPLSVGKLLIETSKINAYKTVKGSTTGLPIFKYGSYNTAPDYIVELNQTYDDSHTTTTNSEQVFTISINLSAGYDEVVAVLLYEHGVDKNTVEPLANLSFQIENNKIVASEVVSSANTTYDLRIVYGDYYLWQKPSLPDTIIDTQNILYQKIEKPDFWEDQETIKDVGDVIYNLYVSLNTGMILEYANEALYYFKDLEKIPQVSSALYNFDYWRDNNLISPQRYETLQNMLNVELRNINLLLSAYSQIYNKMNYELNKLVDQEEELCALMAAEDEFKAFYEESSDTMSADAIYISNCKKYTRRTVESQNTYKNDEYYLGIGYSEQGGTLNTAGTQYTASAIYGQTYGGSYISHQLPSLETLNSLLANTNPEKDTLEFYYFVDETPYKFDSITIDTSSYAINFSWNKTNENKALSNKSMVYILYKTVDRRSGDVHLLDELSAEGSTTINIDSLCDNTISKYNSDLQKLWNSSYQYYQRMINGNQWCSKKIQEVSNMISEKTIKLNNIQANLVSIFGNQWRSINVTNLQDNMSASIEYNDLIGQLNKLGVYIGGTGTRKVTDSDEYYTYQGWYNYYLDALSSLALQLSYTSNETKSLKEIIDELNSKKESWEDRFYGSYSDIIRETKYSDSDQIESSGLYSAAYRQFLQYLQPTKSYGASYISTESLQNAGSEVRVGDLIEVVHPGLNNSVAHNRLKLTLDAPYIKYSDRCMIKYMPAKAINMNSVNLNGTSYLFLDYILSSDYEYINTEYCWTSEKTSVSADIELIDKGSSSITLWGNEENYEPSARNFSGLLHWSGSGENYSVYVGNSSAIATIPVTKNVRHTLVFTTNNGKFSIYQYNTLGQKSNLVVDQTYTGTVKTSVDSTATSPSKGQIYICSNHNAANGTASLQPVKSMKLYRFKMWDNGRMVRDYVPCKNLTSNEIGLYDMVEKRFYPCSDSSKNFSAGNALTHTTTNKTLIEMVAQSKYLYRNAKVHDVQGNKITIEINNTTFDTNYVQFDSDQHDIVEIKIDDKIYNFSPKGPHILNIEKIYDTQPIRLRVTGVTKDLRGSTAQLTVEENTLYNTLIDRLVYMLQH